MAAEAFDATTLDDICVAADARRREVYWARYSRVAGRQSGPWVMRPADIEAEHRWVAWVGSGAREHPDDFAQVLLVGEFPQAVWVARLVRDLLSDGAQVVGSTLDLSEHGSDGAATANALIGQALLPPEPLYLRRPDAAQPVIVSAT
jgi:hypothetical protein